MDKLEYQAAKRAIEKAISHVLRKGCDDVFKPPTFSFSLEQQIITDEDNAFRKQAYTDTLSFLRNANLEQQRVGPIFSSLVAKDDKSFRQVSWIDPFDVVKYLSLALLLFEKIEAARTPKDQNVIHSHRLSDRDEEVFDQNYGYNSFRSRSGELAREYRGKWKVITDISNFYDRIGNHSLENHLLDIGCNKKHVTLLREMLLFWAGDRRSYGVPVGSDASRIISEAVLIDIDRKLGDRGIRYLRYVDDYRIFSNSRAEAHYAIQFLTSLLADEGLALNSKKTEVLRILDEEDPRLEPNQFAAGEHEVIDLEAQVEVKVAMRVSGRTQLSRFYKEPGKDALKKIEKIDKTELIQAFEEASNFEIEDQLKLLIKFFVYSNQDVALLRLAIEKRITSIFYICDALIKEKEKFDTEKRAEILEAVLTALEWEKAPYPYQVPILRLLSSENYKSEAMARALLDSHKISDNALFYRELVLLSYGNIDRARMRTLALETYPLVPAFVKRAIFLAVARHPTLDHDEKRPLLRNMRQHTGDWFISRINSD
jgi:hypothetical protein